MRLFFGIFLIFVSFVGLSGCVRQPGQPSAVSGLYGANCSRADGVGFFSVTGVLNHLDNVCKPQAHCSASHALGNFESIQVAGYNDPQLWLWTGSSSHLFSIADQDAIRASAASAATAHRPAGKFLIGISYFWDEIVGSGASGFFIGANLKYADCSGALPS